MEKISPLEYNKAVAYLDHSSDKGMVHFFDSVVCVISSDGRQVYIHDVKARKFYKEQDTVLVGIYMALKGMYFKDIVVYRNNFEDADTGYAINQLVFKFGPCPFTFIGLRELVHHCEQAKYKNRGK